MLLKVAVQVGLLAEAAVAQRTFEGFLLVVDVAHVALQVGRDGEGTLAVFALVGLFPGVRAQVARQVGRAGEDLAAEFAGVALLELVDGATVLEVLGPFAQHRREELGRIRTRGRQQAHATRRQPGEGEGAVVRVVRVVAP